MQRNVTQAQTESSSFGERRIDRRFRMIIELTAGMIMKNRELSHREARCLVECARKSIHSLSPVYAAEFDLSIRPKLEKLIQDRWPIEEAESFDRDGIVN